MEMARRVEPEWLDELPAHDPRAQRSRRDLVRINALMGNASFVAGELRKPGTDLSYQHAITEVCPRFQLAEIGAGDGGFLLRVARALGVRGVEAILVDRKGAVGAQTRAAFDAQGWKAQVVEADVFDWLRATPPVDAIVANLFLHHFEPGQLGEMLALAAQRAPLFIACEPRRSAFALNGARLLGVVGCNDVSRHDAVVSVRAGFSGHELSALWPHEGPWCVRECARGLFSHLFTARRAP
jgi:hypothetical protein